MNANALMLALPPSVRVGPFTFRLVLTDFHGTRHGFFSSARSVIELETAPANCAMAVDNLMHEIGHAIHWAFHLRGRDPEERIVTLTASAWTQIFRDNPWLAPWISRGLGHDA